MRIQRGFYALSAAAVGAMLGAWFLFPPYTFSPVCTYDLIAKDRVDIEVDGRRYSSELVHQHSYSRKWIAGLNASGCAQTTGTVLAYKLDDGKLVLAPPPACKEIDEQLGKRGAHDYSQALSRGSKAAVSEECMRGARLLGSERMPDGFIVDSASEPSEWEPFNFDEKSAKYGVLVRFVSGEVQATRENPRDDLDRLSPALLKTRFDVAGKWYASPERFLSYSRRQPFRYLAKKAAP